MEKFCSTCNSKKALDEFYTDKNARDGYRYMCIECTLNYNRQRPNQRKDINLRYQWGIDLNQYNEILTKQKFCCAICSRHQSEFRVMFSVDHCHEKNEIRGLLCDPCNRGLGQFKHIHDRLIKAAKYLKSPTTSIAIIGVKSILKVIK